MSDTKRKWNVLSDEQKKICVDNIISILDSSQGAGIIVATQIIDTVTEQVGPIVYNNAIRDVSKIVTDKVQDLEVDIDLLRQS